MTHIKNISARLAGWGAVAVLSVCLGACKDHFDMDQLQSQGKLVVYCFPTNADTTFISVTNSVGVSKYTDRRKAAMLKDAQVSYTVNGQQREVQQWADGTYYVVDPHQPGDRIDVQVEHHAYASVAATTTVPQPIAIELKDIREVSEYDPYWMETNDYHQLLATFTDPAATSNYYAVRVQVRDSVYGEQRMEWADIAVLDEPLLQSVSELDEDFGYENVFYSHFYIFSDQTINGSTYTLHLNVRAGSDGYLSRKEQYRVVLYSITPEYYRFVKSLNDVENNELAQGGFAQLMPTYTNVSHGIGVVGGYWACATEWLGLKK